MKKKSETSENNISTEIERWDPEWILSCDKPFNYIIGPRSSGKTTAIKFVIARRFIKGKTGPMMFIVRLAKEITKSLCDKFITSFNRKRLEAIKGSPIKITSKCEKNVRGSVYIDGELFCEIIPLSTSSALRNETFKTPNIVFDEFIVSPLLTAKYLENEAFLFFELIELVKKECDTYKCYFLGNMLSGYSPLLDNQGIDLAKGDRQRGDEWALEIWRGSNVFRAEMEGKAKSAPDLYRDYAIFNDPHIGARFMQVNQAIDKPFMAPIQMLDGITIRLFKRDRQVIVAQVKVKGLAINNDWVLRNYWGRMRNILLLKDLQGDLYYDNERTFNSVITMLK